MRKCSVEGCERPYSRKGYCGMHRMRLHRHGDVFYTSRRSLGEGTITPQGYINVGHRGEIKRQHIMIVEKILGKLLPTKVVIHHVDGNPSNNHPTNLVVCPNQSYHFLLHVRERALNACGNANWLKCTLCQTYDDPANMSVRRNGVSAMHRECANKYGTAARRRRIARKMIKGAA